MIGILGGLMIFLPGTLLVFFMTPLWQHFRKHSYIKYFLNGVTLTVAALITLTAITQLTSLPLNLISAIVVLITTLTLLSKKVPAPLIIVLVMLLGLVI
ncbi:chromate transporter [Streptococcus uberis]|uniref:chromate transporter n=1 Tax=Streptococcus uberis TaxID=1349 RepID=UPI00349EFAF2